MHEKLVLLPWGPNNYVINLCLFAVWERSSQERIEADILIDSSFQGTFGDET